MGGVRVSGLISGIWGVEGASGAVGDGKRRSHNHDMWVID